MAKSCEAEIWFVRVLKHAASDGGQAAIAEEEGADVERCSDEWRNGVVDGGGKSRRGGGDDGSVRSV